MTCPPIGGHVAITSAYIGLVPSSYGTSNLYVFNSGTHEAVLQVNLSDDYHVDIDRLKDTLRHKITAAIPETAAVNNLFSSKSMYANHTRLMQPTIFAN